ncbi:MAG: hypothetical protein RMK84_20040 [Oscillochloridaceae bacterium]|nr:hypothetical protein [Oscillochloridaceae bacterium]
MEPWMLAAILAGALVIVGALVVLLRRGGWKVSEISVWPPNAKIQPVDNKPVAPGDHLSVTEESKVGNVTIDGAAPNVTVEVRKQSEAGDIAIKR